MKKLTVLTVFLLLAGMLPAQKQYIKLIEEKPGRYFHKRFSSNYIREFEYDFDNSAYMDTEVNGDEITLTVFALDEEQGGYVKSGSVHGTNFDVNHKYVKIGGDVYVAAEKLNGTPLVYEGIYQASYLLYSAGKGVYFHSYSSDNNRGNSTYAPGKVKAKQTEKISDYDLYQRYNKQFEQAAMAYNAEIPKKKIAEIEAKKDDGVTTEFHKTNLNKILFGSLITPANMNNAATYKSKFTVDEPVAMTIFAPKGFNKYVDPNKSDLDKIENLNGNRESAFELKLTFSNGNEASKTFYVAHPEGRFVTVAIADLVYGKGKSKTSDDNNWIIKSAGLGVITQAITVNVKISTLSDDHTVVAEGTYTYTPKAGARMPYGKYCGNTADVKIKDLARVKAGLTASFKKALLSKESTKGLVLTELVIASDWQEDNSMPYKYIVVFFVVKNASGQCFSGSDRYLWFDTKSGPEVGGYFLKAESKHMSITDELYPFCDCK